MGNLSEKISSPTSETQIINTVDEIHDKLAIHEFNPRWDDPPVQRAQLRAELDAYYARLYGLTREELRLLTHDLCEAPCGPDLRHFIFLPRVKLTTK